MLKESKNIDFYTTGRQPSDLDFLRISEWIKNKNRKQVETKKAIATRKRTVKRKVA